MMNATRTHSCGAHAVGKRREPGHVVSPKIGPNDRSRINLLIGVDELTRSSVADPGMKQSSCLLQFFLSTHEFSEGTLFAGKVEAIEKR